MDKLQPGMNKHGNMILSSMYQSPRTVQSGGVPNMERLNSGVDQRMNNTQQRSILPAGRLNQPGMSYTGNMQMNRFPPGGSFANPQFSGYQMKRGMSDMDTVPHTTNSMIRETDVEHELYSENNVNETYGQGNTQSLRNVVQPNIPSIFPFTCGLCCQKFVDLQLYFMHHEQHESRHKYLRMHNCDMGTDGFNRENNGNNLYSCGLCSMRFTSLCFLYTHLQDKEGIHDFILTDNTAHPLDRALTNTNFPTINQNTSLRSVTNIGTYKPMDNPPVLASKVPVVSDNRNVKIKKNNNIKMNNGDVHKPKKRKKRNRVRGPRKTKKLNNVQNEASTKPTDNVGKEERDSEVEPNQTRTSHKDEMFPCAVCGKVLKYQNLMKHVKLHEGAKYPCEKCKSVFNTKFKLQIHKKHVHTEELKYTCDECGKRFKAWPYLKQHSLIHKKEKNIPCTICPMKFRYKAVLRMHMKTHSEMKPYSCNQCDLKFKRPDLLKTHQQYHSAEKTVPCPICSKPFKVKQDMLKHTKIHQPPDNFCEICGKAFVYKYNLKIHMKTHGSAPSIESHNY